VTRNLNKELLYDFWGAEIDKIPPCKKIRGCKRIRNAGTGFCRLEKECTEPGKITSPITNRCVKEGHIHKSKIVNKYMNKLIKEQGESNRGLPRS